MSKTSRRRRRNASSGRARSRAGAESGPAEGRADEREGSPATAETAKGGRSRMPRPGLVAVVVIVAAAAVAAVLLLRPSGRASVTRDGGLNVLLVTLDTTRADRLGCYGYAGAKTPNLDALARDGVRFENVYAQVPLTLPSHCSIMTGEYPFAHGVHNNGTYALAPERTTLAEILKGRGFRTAAFVASFSVDSRFGLGQGFDTYDDNFQAGLPFKPANSERRAGEVAALVTNWLDNLAGERFFAWVHFFDPHLPYDPPSPYASEFAASPYDGEIAYMDEAVGTVVGKLRDKGLLDRTLVVLAGDHGEAFGEKVEIGHGVFLYDETLKVPLIVHAPGRLPAGKVVASRVRLIDIVPTILDMLRVPAPEGVQGESLVPEIERAGTRDRDSYLETFYPRENYGWSELTGLVSGEWKYIRAPKPELYDLGSDPTESQNRAGSEASTALRMNGGLEALIREGAGIAGGSKRELTREEEERLRSLGYVNFAGAGGASAYPDPKDELDVLRLSQKAEAYELQGDYGTAAEAFAELVGLMPGSPSSYINLALCQARLKNFDQAIATLRKGAEMIPGSEPILVRLGLTYLVSGRAEEALSAMNRVLEINPANVDALTAAAGALDALGKKDEARTFLERAIAVEPESKFLRTNLALNLASTGRVADAVEIYRKLIEDYPGDQVLYQHLGVAYGVLGEYADAIASFERAAGIRPTPTVYINLAVACRKAGRLEDAAKYLRLYLADPKGESAQAVKGAEAELEGILAELGK
jgi:arylsulfatase A-like enzyme/tetratricopeptide (TPR) repeat protein